jgi:MFS family permease
MKRITALTFINFFVSGALTLLIPLLLLAKNVNVAEIGVVVSALPLVFLFARLLFAAVADNIGWSHIFLLANWPATTFASLIYFAASSVPGFAAGKIVEGLRDSSYWAVNRTAIFSLSPKRPEHEATKINGVIWLATAVGSAAAGAGIAYVGFSSTLGVLTLVSAAVAIPAVLLWKTGKMPLKPKSFSPRSFFSTLSPKGKGREFWVVSTALMFYSFAVYPLITLLLPVFMSDQLSYSYLTIGFWLLVYNLLAAAVTFLTLKMQLNLKRAAFQSAIGLAAAVFLANSGLLFPAFLCALAFVRGYSVAYFEHSVAKVAKNSKNVSVDIGWLHVPMRFAEFSSVLASGFLVQVVGYAPVFAATGLCFVVFSIMTLRILTQTS